MAVTNATIANLPYTNYLPLMYTNFGGDVQVTQVEPFRPHNIGFAFNEVAQQSWGIPGYQAPYDLYMQPPAVDPRKAEELGNQFLNPVLNNMTQADLNMAQQTISGTKARLTAKMNEPGISNADKSKLQAEISKLEAIEQEIRDFQRTNDANADSQKAAAIRQKAQAAASAALQVLNSVQVTTQGASSSDNSSSETPQGTNVPTTDDVNKFSKEIREFVSQFHDAIDGWGTNDEDMEALLDQIDETNAAQIMFAYNKYQSGRDGESFMEAFMWDADHDQKAQYCRQIVDALREQVEALDVYDEVASDFDVIYDEIDDPVEISNDIVKNYNHIVSVLADHMGSRYGNPREEA